MATATAHPNAHVAVDKAIPSPRRLIASICSSNCRHSQGARSGWFIWHSVARSEHVPKRATGALL